MGVAVAFDPAAWALQYPQFAYLSAAQATGFFEMATMIHRNDGGGPVSSATIQTNLLGLLTAHFAKLLAPLPPSQGGGDASGIVGRIQSATEGSVSVSTQNDYPPGSAQWYQQTQYGSTYWEATRVYRTMRYRPGPVRNMAPWPWQ